MTDKADPTSSPPSDGVVSSAPADALLELETAAGDALTQTLESGSLPNSSAGSGIAGSGSAEPSNTKPSVGKSLPPPKSRAAGPHSSSSKLPPPSRSAPKKASKSSIPPRPRSNRAPAPLPASAKIPQSLGGSALKAPRSALGSQPPSSPPLSVPHSRPALSSKPPLVPSADGSGRWAAANGEAGGDAPDLSPPVLPSLDSAEADGPPQIPAIAPEPGRKSKKARRRRSRRGRRRTVKIPDDAVPTSPSMPQEEEIADEHTLVSDVDAPNRDSVVTDSSAIAVVRPVQVMSDLTPIGPRIATIPPGAAIVAEALATAEAPIAAAAQPVGGGTLRMDELEQAAAAAAAMAAPEAAAGGTATGEATPISRRPPPPRRKTDQFPKETGEGIEEIIPERMSLPGQGEPVAESGLGSGVEPTSRRPPPPPRARGASIPPDTPFPSSTEASVPQAETPAPAQSAAAEAEARAQEAEAAAQAAQDRLRAAEERAKAARAKAKPPRRPWYVEIFEKELLRTLDNPKKRDVEKEVTFIEESLALQPGDRVLDLACGTGVHAVELASRGYQVVGVDLSEMMLNLAREYNKQRDTSVSFIQGDMRQLNLEEVFDGIYCWSTSFGYFDDEQNINVLQRITRALRPGGRLALDVTNRDFVAARAPTMAWFEKVGCVCMDEMNFDFLTSRMITKRMVLFDDGKSREIEMSIRLYTLHELGKHLEALGHKVLQVSGHRAHRGAYFGCSSPRLMITSERPEEPSEDS